MSNRRRSKAEMKQVYMIRRIVAALVLILILVAIFTKCGKKENALEQNQNQTTTTNSDFTEVPDSSQVILPSEETQPIEPTTETDPAQTTEVDPELKSAIEANTQALKEVYDEYADITYNPQNNSYQFNLKGDYKDLVISRGTATGEDLPEELKTFWDTLKEKITTTSENLAETVEPGIELHVIDPEDDAETLLFIKDGSEVFDRLN